MEYQEDATGKDLSIDIDYTAMRAQAAASDPSTASRLSLLSAARVSFPLQANNNLSLDYYDESAYSLASTCNLIANIISAAAFFLSLLALLGAKLVGLEMLAVFQVAFLAMLSLDDMTPLMDSLGGLSYSVGYNKISSYNNIQNLKSEFIALEFNEQFIKNYNLTFLLIGVPLILALVFKIISKVHGSKGNRTKAEKFNRYFQLSIG